MQQNMDQDSNFERWSETEHWSNSFIVVEHWSNSSKNATVELIKDFKEPWRHQTRTANCNIRWQKADKHTVGEAIGDCGVAQMLHTGQRSEMASHRSTQSWWKARLQTGRTRTARLGGVEAEHLLLHPLALRSLRLNNPTKLPQLRFRWLSSSPPSCLSSASICSLQCGATRRDSS